MTDPGYAGDRDALRALEQLTHVDDARFAVGLDMLRPCEPREYRRRRRRRRAAVVCCATLTSLLLAGWWLLDWSVAALLTAEAAVLAVLIVRRGRRS